MDIWGTQVLASVEDIVEAVRYELNKQGYDLLKDIKPTYQNIMVTCINHADGQESNPSLGISTVDTKDYKGNIVPAGTCNCFACDYRADLPTFVSNAFGYNDKGMFGYKWIIKNFANLDIEHRQSIKLDMERDKKQVREVTQTIHDSVLEKYRYFHPYMYKRKLTDKVINYFDVGYDKDAHALTFPVHDLEGKCALIQRRSIGRKFFMNDEGADKGNYIYGLYQIYLNISWIKEIYITESPIDALTLWTVRKPAVSIMGAKATKRQIELLQQIPIRKFILALDNDNAGNNGSDYIKKELEKHKLFYRVQFPQGVKDINDLSEEQLKSLSYSIL